MNNNTTPYNQSLGALRSTITITLHSASATRLWNGRDAVKKDKNHVARIPSMPECLSLLTRIQQDAVQDDPFADYALIRFEKMVLKHRQEMKTITEKLVDVYADMLPEGVDVSNCLNVNPVQYPIFANSQLGYQLIYLLVDFDALARSVATAAHIALMTRNQASEWLEAGAKLVRQCYGVVNAYRSSGVTRQDATQNNERYQEAVKRFKVELPDEVISGKSRAQYAPNIALAVNSDAGANLIPSPETEVEDI